jgi:hypothetical protein
VPGSGAVVVVVVEVVMVVEVVVLVVEDVVVVELDGGAPIVFDTEDADS